MIANKTITRTISAISICLATATVAQAGPDREDPAASGAKLTQEIIDQIYASGSKTAPRPPLLEEICPILAAAS